MTCPGKELAEQVKRSMDGLAFTKTITFAAYFFKDVQDYAQTADEYVAPPDEEYQPRVSFASHFVRSCYPTYRVIGDAPM